MIQAGSRFLQYFRQESGDNRILRFDAFMRLALYAPDIGYYIRKRKRTGFSPGTDFFTSSNIGSLFGELVLKSVENLLKYYGISPRDYNFIEIGAEDDEGILSGIPHPFASARCIQIGMPIEIKENCIVFSNELFDAQPFRRFVIKDGKWRELAVKEKDGSFYEMLLSGEVNEAWLPPALPLPENYHFDAPVGTKILINNIVSLPWKGLFLAIDYGKSFKELSAYTPQGTLRAYSHHRQNNDLLCSPSEQDLTGHICWDWIKDALLEHGFASPVLQSQESFFIHHAASVLERTMRLPDSVENIPRKAALRQLIHPAELGQKFEVMYAFRK